MLLLVVVAVGSYYAARFLLEGFPRLATRTTSTSAPTGPMTTTSSCPRSHAGTRVRTTSPDRRLGQRSRRADRGRAAGVRVLARGREVVDPDEVEPQRRHADQRQVRGVAAPPARGRAGVQVGGVHDPGDEGPDLLGVPVPVRRPGLVRPDRPGDQHRERPHREREGVDPVGRSGRAPAERGQPGEVAAVCGRRASGPRA